MITRSGVLLCRACRQQTQLRFYWAKEMARYFRSLKQDPEAAPSRLGTEATNRAGQPANGLTPSV